MKTKKNGYILKSLLLGVIIAICLKLFVFDIDTVSGTSMEPAIKDKQSVTINKLAYGIIKPFSNTLWFSWASPKPGDIIFFYQNNKPVIKRCIAVEFEVLDFSANTSYSLRVGDKEIPLTEYQFQRIKFNTFVPENTILAVGDNYDKSVDSRDYGFIPVKNILGKIVCK